MKNFYLFLTTITAFFLGGTANAQCDYTITMNDTWGDGWNGANCEVYESGSLVKTWSLGSGATGIDIYTAVDGDALEFRWNAGGYDGEISLTIVNPDGIIVYDGGAPSAGAFASDNFNNPACAPWSFTVPQCSDLSSFPDAWLTNGSGGSAWLSGGTSTPSGSTGPSSDADGGSGFYFTEASGIYNTLYRIAGTFDFAANTPDKFTMSYNMNGAATGSLTVTVDGVAVFTISGNQGDVWTPIAVDLTPYIGNPSVEIAIEGVTGTAYTSDISIDNICITALAPPACASNLSPANSATDISSLPTLSWDATSSASSYDVYFGTLAQLLGSGIPVVSNNQTATTYSPTALSSNTTYYWKVVPANVAGEASSCGTISFTTAAPSPIITTSSLTAYGGICTGLTSTNSFTLSGIDLTSNVTIASLSGYSYSTSSGGTYSSSLSITPSGGSVSETIYVKFTPTAASDYSGTIDVSSAGASNANVTASGSGLESPTADAGSDVSLCSGQIANLSGSGTGPTGTTTGSASGNATVTGTDQGQATATYTFSGLPSGATITDVSVNVTSPGSNCPGWYDVTTFLNGADQGSGCAGTTSYSGLNGSTAEGLIVSVRANDQDVYNDGITVTFSVTLSYQVVSSGVSYDWSSSTSSWTSSDASTTDSPSSSTTYTLLVTSDINSCTASSDVTATIAGTAPSAPTASAADAAVNVGGTTTLTASGAGGTYTWYDAASGGNNLGSGSTLAMPVNCSSGSATYYVDEEDGGCVSGTRGSVSVTIREMLTTDPSNSLICSSGGSVTLSSQLTGGSNISWSPNTNLSTTSGSSTVASPTTTTVYTMDASVTGCGSVSETKSIGVIDGVSFTPTAASGSVCATETDVLSSNLTSSGFVSETTTYSMDSPSGETYLVTGGSATVAATSCIYCPLDDAAWEAIPIGFTYNFFGNDYTTVNVGVNGNVQFGTYNGTASGGLGDFAFTSFPNAAEPLNVIAAPAVDLNAGDGGDIRYWVKGIAPTRVFILEWNGVPGYGSNGTNTSQIKLFETTGNVEVHVQNSSSTSNKVVGLQNADASIGTTASSGTATLTNQAWKFIPGADYTFQWSSAGADISGATSGTYTTDALATAGTVTYTVSATNPNTACASSEDVSITVNSLPASPNSAGDVTACNTSGDQTLTVTTGAGVTADWYDASTAGTNVQSASLTYTTATSGTYYAEAVNSTTNCKSSSRTAVALNLNNAPSAPTSSNPSYCQGATPTALSATADGGNSLAWYTAAPNSPSASGATAAGSTPTPSTSSTGTTSYFVSQTSGSNGCESQLTQVDVLVNGTPDAPVATDPGAYCEDDVASQLTATATGGNTLTWYTDPTSNAGQTTTAPTPSTVSSGTTNYYVSDVNDGTGCEGARTSVTVTVNPSITATVSNSASSTSACSGGAITFTATPTNGGSPTYQWYLNGSPQAGEVLNIYTTPMVPNPGDEIYVQMTPSAQTCLTSTSATSSNTVSLTAEASTPAVDIASTDGDNTICPNESVTFSINSSANMGSTPTYKWYKNGSAIQGQGASTYITTDLVDSDDITVEMTSSLDGACLTSPAATSIGITTTVNPATTISSQPSSASSCEGSSQSYAVTATGTGTLTYQWMIDGSNITGNASATTSDLTLSGIGASDAASYTVAVQGGCGAATTSSAATLSLSDATSISSQPSGVTDCAGETANFTVSAAGDGSLTYQWRKDGSPLSGETSSSLAVSNIATSNAGNYSVVVTGGCGALASSDAALAVNPATSISSDPAASTICAGNTASFSVTASGTGSLSYQWQLDGSDVSGETSSTLAVSNAQSVNAGSYTVIVTGSCGNSTSSGAALQVDSPPVITSGDFIDVSTCGENEYDVTLSNSLSGSWTESPVGAAFFNSTQGNQTITPYASGYDQSVVLTWTENQGGCSGQSDAVTVYFNQPLPIVGADTYSYLWGGLTSSDWSVASNWYKWTAVGNSYKWIKPSNAPNASTCKVNILPTDGTCIGTNNSAVVSGSVGDLVVDPNATVSLGNSTLSIKGNLVNNGSIEGSTGGLTFDASTGDQTISGNSLTLNNLNIDKQTSGDLIITTGMSVRNVLTMTSGNIIVSGADPLILGESSANPGTLTHSLGTVIGQLRRYFDNTDGDSRFFPVGNASVTRDVTVTFPSGSGADQYLTASYVSGAPTFFGGDPMVGLPLITETGQLITNYHNEGHWEINPTGDDYQSPINAKAYTISLHMNGMTDATDYTKTRIIKSAGSNTANQHHATWAALTQQSVTGDNSNFTLNAISTGFSVFGGGSDNGDPLPVELVSFTGDCADGVVDVTWTTASEHNSSHFELENSRDGVTWDVVYTKDAAGQSTELIEYTYNDVHANGGDNYYRLTQVDIDGTSKTYDVINVSCSQTTSGYFSIFPNPSSGSFQVILNNSEIIGDARMNVVDTKGNIVLSKSLDVKSGINMYVVNEVLAPGIYYVSVQNGDKVTVVLKHSVK